VFCSLRACNECANSSGESEQEMSALCDKWNPMPQCCSFVIYRAAFVFISALLAPATTHARCARLLTDLLHASLAILEHLEIKQFQKCATLNM
jgi:hypothetical protein